MGIDKLVKGHNEAGAVGDLVSSLTGVPGVGQTVKATMIGKTAIEEAVHTLNGDKPEKTVDQSKIAELAKTAEKMGLSSEIKPAAVATFEGPGSTEPKPIAAEADLRLRD